MINRLYMSSHFKKVLGFTLIEVLIFTALLTMMIFGFLRYLYAFNDNDIDLYENVSRAY